jgi:probable addiction module antidote protein
MPVETFPFDAAEHLDTPKSEAELLADAFETGDTAYIAQALGTVARARPRGGPHPAGALQGAERAG